MLIRQLFEKDRDPTRTLNEVVDAEQDIDVRSEIDEYVFTEHTREYLRTLIDGILDTAQGTTPDCLRGWISGFFGSGKSHFLKLAAALLENRALNVGGAERHALEYAVQRHNLDLPWQRLAREFHVRSVRVNLALAHGGGKTAQEQPLLYRLTSEVNRAWGLSPVPHVAEIEREIQKAKKWSAFQDAVLKHHAATGVVGDDGAPLPWEHPDIRTKAADANQALEAVLPGLLTKVHNARAYIEDKEAQKPGPEDVVRLALDLARNAHPEMGRVLLCLDEVALYLRGNQGTFDADRVSQVQGLAETVKNKGKGKVFLFATAQLSVETVDESFAAASEYVNFLRDRFPKGGRLALVESDIDTVVKERWLKKDTSSAAYGVLRDRLTKPRPGGGGTEGDILARAAKLHEENVVRDAPLLTDANAVLAYYPFLPYHVGLLQRLLAALRRDHRQIDQAAAQSRALLTSVRSVFVRQNGANLADTELGALVTFDLIYDVIRDVVRKRDAQTDLWITSDIATLDKGATTGVRVASVAKVIFLLQHLNAPDRRGVRVDADNVAALLYPRLGAPWESHRKEVGDACATLLDQHFIGDDPVNGFRFFRKDERTFQSEVEAQAVDAAKRRSTLMEAIEAKVGAMGMKQVPYAWHKIPVALTVHVEQTTLPDPNADPQGLELHVIWPRAQMPANQIKVWASQFKGASHLALWVLGPSDADALVSRQLKLASTIHDYQQRHGNQTVDLLRGEQARLSALKEHDIPAAIERAITTGTLIHGGVDTPLEGQLKKPQDVFKETLKRAADHVFTEMEIGLAQVDEAGLKKVLSWKPGQAQPDFFAKLRLFDGDGNALVDKPFLKELTLALQGRPEDQRTGSALLERFQRAPHAWPERAVKAGLGALLRGRQITVKLADGTVLRNEGDPKAEGWLTGTQLFNKGVLDLSDVKLTLEDRGALTEIFAEVFLQPGADTVEKLEQRVRDNALADFLARAREAFADMNARQLPGTTSLKTLIGVLEAANGADLLSGKLKQLVLKARELAKRDEKPAAALKPLADLLREVLRRQAQLRRIADARLRATSLYPVWQHRPAGAAHAAEVAVLSTLAGSDKLILEADQALQADEALFALYAADYQAVHEERGQRVQAALDELAGHPGWSRVSPEMQEQARKPIASLACDAPVLLALPGDAAGCCGVCRKSLEELSAQLEMIEHRKAKALEKLDETLAPSPRERGRRGTDRPPAPELSFSMEVASVEDLTRLYERIAEEARAVRAWPRRVKVGFGDPSE